MPNPSLSAAQTGVRGVHPVRASERYTRHRTCILGVRLAPLKNDYSEIKGFSVRNMQCMMQFFNEYNQELTMVKSPALPIAQSVISQLSGYNFTLPIKHLDWTHNLILRVL